MKALRWGMLVLLALAGLALLVRSALPPRIAEGSALWIELSGDYVESPERPWLAQLAGLTQRPLVSLLSELRKAELDDRLAHVVLHVRDLRVGWAKAQELRAAIEALSAAGRHPVAYLDVPGFGANKGYFVASAADEVHLAPGGGAPLLGLAQEYVFLGGLWELLGARVEVTQAGTYKGAAESFAGREMSDAYREQAERLLDSVDGQFVDGIAASRGLEPQAVRRALAAAPSDPEVLMQLGLVDGAAPRRALLEALGDPELVESATWARVDPASLGFEPEATFALIYGSGTIVSGRGSVSRSGRPVIASDTIVEAIESAADDAAIGAIVLRIDSPGGGPFPSEQIWHALRAAREKKPVIASFSDYAASGAYYLASAADAIVADPATLTGSIGVFAIRPSLGGVFERLEIGFETLSRAPHAELLLSTPPLSPETRDWLQADVDAVYRRFLARVAEGRGVEPEAVAAVAEGRVWTGEQALERGLVDELGGLRAAVGVARARLGLEPDTDVALAIYPPPRPLLQQLQEALRTRVAQSLRPALPWSPLLDRIGGWLEALAAGGPVLLPPIFLEIR
ncbi:MAG: signal peptide peptidase SppA [Myxococcota bacterium]|nr:signal peptide peptidase SppA [Myxococcota bacterium]